MCHEPGRHRYCRLCRRCGHGLGHYTIKIISDLPEIRSGHPPQGSRYMRWDVIQNPAGKKSERLVGKNSDQLKADCRFIPVPQLETKLSSASSGSSDCNEIPAPISAQIGPITLLSCIKSRKSRKAFLQESNMIKIAVNAVPTKNISRQY